MQIERYVGKVSGPLLDRIDLHIELPAVPFPELSAKAEGTGSASMRNGALGFSSKFMRILKKMRAHRAM